MNRKINVRKTLLIVLAAGVCLGGVLWHLKERKKKSTSGDVSAQVAARSKNEAGKAHVGKKTEGTESGAAVQKGSKEQPLGTESDDAEVDRELEPVQQALDSIDPKVIVSGARKIMNHKNAKVRIKAVEALAWAKEDGFPDLNKMLLDSDPDVVRAAFEAWGLEMQTMESSTEKAALLKEVGEAAMNNGAEAFQDVLDAMIDLSDSAALTLLEGYAAQTKDSEILEKIYEAVNDHAQPEEVVQSQEDLQKAIAEFRLRQAQEEAEEARQE